jgi:DGQHR domain-containing protein
MTDQQDAANLKTEAQDMFERCIREGLTPIAGVQISPDEGRGIGQFLFSASLTTICEITKDPFPYLGGATKAEKARWTEEDREYADLYQLIQREFSNKKRKNVDKIADYVRKMIDAKEVGFLPSPILWFHDDDIYVTERFIGVRRTALPHIIDGSTRIAALHRLKRGASKEYLEKMQQVKVPVLAIYGPEVDQDTAAQIFCDVNFRAVAVDPSTAKAMDKRDIHVRLSKEVVRAIPVLKDRVAPRRQLTASDTRLFTTYALFQSLRCFTDGIESLDKSFNSKALNDDSFSEVLQKATDVWNQLELLFGAQWLEVDARDKYLHLQAPVLKAISAHLRHSYFPAEDITKKQECIGFLGAIDWSRQNEGWLGILTSRQGTKTIKVINNDPVVRELTKLLDQRDPRLPRRAAAAAA